MNVPNPDAVLIACPVPGIEDDSRQAPGGLVSLATCARSHGFQVVVCDLAGQVPESAWEWIPEAKVYGFATYTANYHCAVTLAHQLRQRSPGALLVAGGPHATALPAEVARDFRCVVRGEGEGPFLAILNAVRQRQLDRLPRILSSPPILDLDGLPFPDFAAFCDMRRYHRQIEGRPAICLDSSRGCSFRCLFCNSNVAGHGHGAWRARTAESVLAEIRGHLCRGWTAFRFNDDNFLSDRRRALEICARLRPLAVKFRIFGRAESLDDRELCDALAEAGCRQVGVGVESLSPSMLARMGKAQRVERICRGIETAHAVGLLIRGFFVVGFPGETDSTVAESIAGLQSLPLDDAVVYPCIPYPGTDLFEQPDKHGIAWIDPEWDHYIQVGRNRAAGFVMATREFGPEQVRHWHAQYAAAFDDLGFRWCDTSGRVV